MTTILKERDQPVRTAAGEIGVSTRMVRFLLNGARCPSPATCVALERWSKGRIKAANAALIAVRDPAPPHHIRPDEPDDDGTVGDDAATDETGEQETAARRYGSMK